MQVLHPYTVLPEASVVLTLGMFDGVHLGHRALLARTRELADQYHTRAAVYTMRNHPAHMWGKSAPPLLMTAAEKCALMRALGIDDVYAVEFSREMAGLSPRMFVDQLCAVLDIRAAVIGFDFTFGRGGEGDADSFRALGKAHGFAVEVIEPVSRDGKVSSQRIRDALLAGDAAMAARLLGASYMLSGTVHSCRGLGSRLGFPTANIAPGGQERGKLLPQNGVYITRAGVMGGSYASMTNIGERPTVDGSGNISIETHILGFGHNCVGEQLHISFMEKIRDEAHFPSLEALRAQLQRDCECVRKYFTAVNI